jgi:hypothetical protein
MDYLGTKAIERVVGNTRECLNVRFGRGNAVVTSELHIGIYGKAGEGILKPIIEV